MNIIQKIESLEISMRVRQKTGKVEILRQHLKNITQKIPAANHIR